MNESFELKNPVSALPSLRVSSFKDRSIFDQLKSYNFFTAVIVIKGSGDFVADASAYSFDSGSLMTFSLYQPFKIDFESNCEGYMVSFHPDFFCLHKHRDEVSCNGILFNNIYESPLIKLTEQDRQELLPAFEGLMSEMQREVTDSEVLLSYLKILLINGSRIKVTKRQGQPNQKSNTPEKLIALQTVIEANFRTMHSAATYAELLNSSQSALNRACKDHFNKTLANLITDRIILEAKRELYLTSKLVKTIAYDMGFSDEFHFSRYFKKNIGISPQNFRDTVGVGKANGD